MAQNTDPFISFLAYKINSDPLNVPFETINPPQNNTNNNSSTGVITEVVEYVKKNKGAAVGLGICIPLIIIGGIVAGCYFLKKRKDAQAKGGSNQKEKDLEKQKHTEPKKVDKKDSSDKNKKKKAEEKRAKENDEDFDDINKAITNEDIKLQIDTKQDLVDNNMTNIERSSVLNSLRGIQLKSPAGQQKMEEEVFDNLKGLDISYSSEHSDDG